MKKVIGWTALGCTTTTKKRFDKLKSDLKLSADDSLNHILDFYEERA